MRPQIFAALPDLRNVVFPDSLPPVLYLVCTRHAGYANTRRGPCAHCESERLSIAAEGSSAKELVFLLDDRTVEFRTDLSAIDTKIGDVVPLNDGYIQVTAVEVVTGYLAPGEQGYVRLFGRYGSWQDHASMFGTP